MTDHVCAYGCRFAGEVARVELREGGIEVVGVERDDRRDPLVGVDLDDAEHFDVESGRGLAPDMC